MADSTTFDKLLRDGEAAFEQGNLEEARALFEEIISQVPEHADAHNNLGALAMHEGRFEQAISFFRATLACDATHPESNENLARCLEHQGQFAEALEYYRQSCTHGSESTAILNSMAHCCIEMSELEAARRHIEQSLHLDSDQPDLVFLLHEMRNQAEAAPTGPKPESQPVIGLISIWFERGQSYVTKAFRDALAAEYDTHVFARTGGVNGTPMLDTSGQWNVVNLTTWPSYDIPGEAAQQWIRENRIDTVIFNEEYDWNLVRACKEAGARVVTYLDYFKEDWRQRMAIYDGVLCSSRRTYDLVAPLGNAHYVGWGVDLDAFKPREHEGRRHTFFHNAGWLGINFRKMTPAAILAFDAVSRRFKNASLFVHAQAGLDKLPPEVAAIVESNPHITYHVETVPPPGLYHLGRVFLFPTKLEGLGLPLPEALASGLPAIVTDAPPMREFMEEGRTGKLVKVAAEVTREDNIAFPETVIDVNDLAQKMAEFLQNPAEIDKMAEQARAHAEAHLSYADFAARVREAVIKITSA